MKKLSLSLFLIIAATIIVVAILLAPEQIKNVYFWVTIGWLVFLSFINWFVSTYIFLKDGKNSINPKFGILPSLNIVVFIYSIISAAFLLFTWFTNDFEVLPNWHLITQILLFSTISIFTVFFLFASKGAEISQGNFDIDKGKLLSTTEHLKSQDTNDEDKKYLSELYEVIKYSIPHLTKLKSEENYRDLTKIFKKHFINIEKVKTEIIKKAITIAKNC